MPICNVGSVCQLSVQRAQRAGGKGYHIDQLFGPATHMSFFSMKVCCAASMLSVVLDFVVFDGLRVQGSADMCRGGHLHAGTREPA